MKKLFVLLACAFGFASCGVQLISESVNTINRAALADLNLDREDYEVLNTLTADATVVNRDISKKKREISDINGEFSVKWKKMMKGPFSRKAPIWICKDFQGILCTGALYDLPAKTADHADPLDMAQRLALYRLINQAQQEGADAILEPAYTIALEQTGRRQVVYKATVTAKIIKLKTDR